METAVAGESSFSPWARSFRPGGPDTGLDRMGPSPVASEMSKNSESTTQFSQLKDDKERKREKNILRRRRKRLRKREKSQRQVRSTAEEDNTVFVQLRLIQFPSQSTISNHFESQLK